MKLFQVSNIFANLTGSILPALISFITIPFYIDLLGLENWSIVGVYSVLATVFLVSDFGVAQTANREFAKKYHGDIHRISLFTEFIAFYIAQISLVLLIGSVIFLVLSYFAPDWLAKFGLKTYSPFLIVIIICSSFRILINLLNGSLQGVGLFSIQAKLNCLFSLINFVGGLFWLLWTVPDLQHYFSWLLISNTAHVLLGGSIIFLLSKNGNRPVFKPDFKLFKSNIGFSRDLFIIGITGAIISQADKVAVSITGSISDFAVYSVAYSLIGLMTIFIQPLYAAFFTLFSRLGNDVDIQIREEKFLFAFSCTVFLIAFPCLFVAFNSGIIMELWLADRNLNEDLPWIATILTFAAFINGIMHVPHALLLTTGKAIFSIYINIVLIIIMLPLVSLLSFFYGMMGASVSWLIINIIYYLIAFRIINSKTGLTLVIHRLSFFVILTFLYCGVLQLVSLLFSSVIENNWFDLISAMLVYLTGFTLYIKVVKPIRHRETILQIFKRDWI